MILIKGGQVIDPSTNTEGEFDILVEGTTIKDVQKRGAIPDSAAREVIEAKGKWITPGYVDVHVHLREPGFEWKETISTGGRAAVLGGYTTICCMPNTSPVNDCAEITKFILERATETKARVFPIGAVSKGLKGEQMAPLSELRKAGCIAFSDDGEPVWNSGLMRRALEWAQMLDVPICCHEEDKNLSCGGSMNESPLSVKLGLKGMNKVAEDVMVARDIELARLTKSKVHICHVSSARSAELIRRAKNDGISITAEVTPHHLTLTEESVGNYDTYSKMSPPLREQEDVDALIAALKDSTIDCVASDHAPHEEDSKRVEFGKATFGIIGLQTSLALMLELVHKGTISKMRAFSSMSTAPARTFGFDCGSLKKGSRADIVIIDPDFKWKFLKESVVSLSANSPFLGREVTGRADTVLVNGKVVVKGAEII